MKITRTLTALALALTLGAAACGPDDDDGARAEPEPETTTTEETTTTTAEVDCEALTDDWWEAPPDSEEETEIGEQLAAGGCEVPDLSTDGSLDLEGALTIEQAGDVALSDVDLAEFCDTFEQLGDELSFAAWTAGFDGAAEEFGFSDREIFDEVISRC